MPSGPGVLLFAISVMIFLMGCCLRRFCVHLHPFRHHLFSQLRHDWSSSRWHWWNHSSSRGDWHLFSQLRHVWSSSRLHWWNHSSSRGDWSSSMENWHTHCSRRRRMSWQQPLINPRSTANTWSLRLSWSGRLRLRLGRSMCRLTCINNYQDAAKEI